MRVVIVGKSVFVDFSRCLKAVKANCAVTLCVRFRIGVGLFGQAWLGWLGTLAKLA